MDIVRYIVVFDVNVYLRAAELIGPPFSWDNFNATTVQVRDEPVPCTRLGADAIRALAACQSGKFVGRSPLEVWTNAHIDSLVLSKAEQSVEPDADGNRGLGWSASDAAALVTDLVGGLTTKSNGGTLGAGHFPDGNPPLDHEDGMVFGACHELSKSDLLAEVLCVTGDKAFIAASQTPTFPNHSRVMHPAQFLAVVRSARAKAGIQLMRPPAP